MAPTGDDKVPLHDEAKARSQWRRGETLIEGESDDTALPASEADDARPRGSGGEGRPGRGRPGSFPPPD